MTDSPVRQDASTTIKSDSALSRLFWVGMAVFLIVMVLLGFGSTYGRQLVLGQEISGHVATETDWVIHVHAAVFVGWMVFLLAQTILAAPGQIQTHMALGKYVGTGMGLAILVAGSLITLEFAQAAISKGLFTRAEVKLINMVPWSGLLFFALLAGLGLLYRRRPEQHKRYMTFATITLAFATSSRMGYLLGSWTSEVCVALMVAPILAYDLYTEDSLYTATVVGTGAVVLRLVVGAYVGAGL